MEGIETGADVTDSTNVLAAGAVMQTGVQTIAGNKTFSGATTTVSGNLVVNGTTTTVNTSSMQVEDPIIKLGHGNSANSVDLGFYGQYTDSGTKYAGLIRDSAGGFKFFEGVSTEPSAAGTDWTSGGQAVQTPLANVEAAEISGTTLNVAATSVTETNLNTSTTTLDSVVLGNWRMVVSSGDALVIQHLASGTWTNKHIFRA